MTSRAEARHQRFERWLRIVADTLRDHPEWRVQTFYEDRAGGNLLVLSAEPVGGRSAPSDSPAGDPDGDSSGGLVALHVHRATRGPTDLGRAALEAEATKALAASLILVADSSAAVARLSAAIEDLHRSLSRAHNAKRKFVHRVEAMAEHLAATFDERAGGYPTRDLERLRSWVPEATMMVGVQARFRHREHEEGARWWNPGEWLQSDSGKLAREAKRFPSRYAARVWAHERWRAALYEGGQFLLAGVALTQSGGQPSASVPHEREREHGEEGGELVTDAIDIDDQADSGAGDCGGCDVPDCDVSDCGITDLDCPGIDVPDCGSCCG